MRWKRSLVGFISVLLGAAVFACGQKREEPVMEKASVYIRCYSEEAAKVWSKIAGTYRTEQGVNLRVLDPDEIAGDDNQPTIAVLEKATDYEKWRDRCMDLSDTRMYAWLLDQSMALKEKKSVTAVPCGMKGFGIIYNKGMTDRYFEKEDRAVKSEDMDGIQTFEEFREVVEDMTENQQELGYRGVFASPYLGEGENGWQMELLEAALSLEQQERGNSEKAKTDFLYSDSVRDLVDLYFDNSCTGKNSLWRKSQEDACREFAEGEAVMIQGDDQTYQKISELAEDVIPKKEIRYLPLMPWEGSTEGLCVEADDYLCINDEASQGSKKAAVTFLEWLYETDQGKEYVTKEMGYTAPYVTFSEEDIPADPLALEMVIAAEKQKIHFVDWSSETVHRIDEEVLRQNLLEYARTLKTWEEVSTEIRKELNETEDEKNRKIPGGWKYQLAGDSFLFTLFLPFS